MSDFLNIQKLSKLQLKKERVELNGYEGLEMHVYVKELTGSKYNAVLAKAMAKGKLDPQVYADQLVAESACTEDGHRAMTDKEVQALPKPWLDLIFAKAQALNQINADEELKGN